MKFIKILVTGYVASLMALRVKRILSKMFGKDHAAQQPQPKQPKFNPYKTNSANQNKVVVVETIWIGMTAKQLIQSFGPALTKQYQGNREIWTYLHLKGQGTQTAIAIQNGVIVNWQDIRPTPAARFSAPSR